MNTGKVLWWDERDGFGLILGDDGRKYYFDESVTNKTAPKASRVQFTVNDQISDCLCAMSVSALN